jgi:hypothetical protein
MEMNSQSASNTDARVAFISIKMLGRMSVQCKPKRPVLKEV